MSADLVREVDLVSLDTLWSGQLLRTTQAGSGRNGSLTWCQGCRCSSPHRTPAALLLLTSALPLTLRACLLPAFLVLLFCSQTCSGSPCPTRGILFSFWRRNIWEKRQKLSPRIWRANSWLWFKLAELLTPSLLRCADQLLKISCPVHKAQLPAWPHSPPLTAQLPHWPFSFPPTLRPLALAS